MKLSHYTAGKVRKSRREKDQEAADAKKREEEANAAQAYAEFLDAFEGGEVARRKGGSGFVKADSNMAYAPSIPSSERRARLRVSFVTIASRGSVDWHAETVPITSRSSSPETKRKEGHGLFSGRNQKVTQHFVPIQRLTC